MTTGASPNFVAIFLGQNPTETDGFSPGDERPVYVLPQGDGTVVVGGCTIRETPSTAASLRVPGEGGWQSPELDEELAKDPKLLLFRKTKFFEHAVEQNESKSSGLVMVCSFWVIFGRKYSGLNCRTSSTTPNNGALRSKMLRCCAKVWGGDPSETRAPESSAMPRTPRCIEFSESLTTWKTSIFLIVKRLEFLSYFQHHVVLGEGLVFQGS